MRALSIAAAIGLVLAACGGGAGGGGGAASGAVTITASEYEFAPGSVTVKAGQEIRLVLTNGGKKDHSWGVGRRVKKAGENVVGYEEQLLAGVKVRYERDGKPVEFTDVAATPAPGGPADAIVLHLAKGKSPITLIFTIPAGKAGEWEMACFEEKGIHYEEGMHGKFVVEK